MRARAWMVTCVWLLAPVIALAAVVWGNPKANLTIVLDGPGLTVGSGYVDYVDWEDCNTPTVWRQDVDGDVSLLDGLDATADGPRCASTLVWEDLTVKGVNSSGPFVLSVPDDQVTMTPQSPSASVYYTVTSGSFTGPLSMKVVDR